MTDNTRTELRRAQTEIERLRFELLLVSKLAAEEPMFFNPLNAAHAAKIRDNVLGNAEKYVRDVSKEIQQENSGLSSQDEIAENWYTNCPQHEDKQK